MTPATIVPATPSPGELDIILRQADLLARSTIIPREYQRNPGNIVAAALIGRAFGWDAITAMRMVNVIQGTATLKPEAQLALIRAAGHSVTIKRHPDRVSATGRRADNGDTDTQQFTIDDARRAGLDRNGTWKAYPLDMCQWRAVSRLARSLFGDVVLGAGYTPEEVALARDPAAEVPAADYVPAEVVPAEPAPLPAGDVEALEVEDTGGYDTAELWRDRVRELAAQVKAAGLGDWVRDQGFGWPWRRDACEQILARLGDTDPDDLDEFSEDPF